MLNLHAFVHFNIYLRIQVFFSYIVSVAQAKAPARQPSIDLCINYISILQLCVWSNCDAVVVIAAATAANVIIV